MAKTFETVSMLDDYHVPRLCQSCGGIMIFKGVGEYKCENCGELAYDDYGKVRMFLEKKPGANAVEVEKETGVSQKTIRQMLKESRLQVAEGSQSFLRCEICGKNIRSGRLCPECEIKAHRNLEDQQRRLSNANLHGVVMGRTGEDGQKRFHRN